MIKVMLKSKYIRVFALIILETLLSFVVSAFISSTFTLVILLLIHNHFLSKR